MQPARRQGTAGGAGGDAVPHLQQALRQLGRFRWILLLLHSRLLAVLGLHRALANSHHTGGAAAGHRCADQYPDAKLSVWAGQSGCP